ncbi:hypothetical protein AVEN_121335-1, partial [Araneus ventricosus]
VIKGDRSIFDQGERKGRRDEDKAQLALASLAVKERPADGVYDLEGKFKKLISQ